MPTVAAMCMGVAVSSLVELLGHDGGEEVFKGQEGVERRRGFHPQEIQDAAVQLGYHVTTVETRPQIGYSNMDCVDLGYSEERLQSYLALGRSMVIGELRKPNMKIVGHAVGYDPETKRYYDARANGLITLDCPIMKRLILVFIDPKIKNG